MFITAVDEALRTFLCTRLPLPSDAGEVSFDAPTPEWAAGLRHPTVSLFLHRVDKSDQLTRAPQRRFDANGRPERRSTSVQMVDLSYVLSVWAADAVTEHRLLGRAVSALATMPTLSTPTGAAGPTAVSLGSREQSAAAAPFAMAWPLKAFVAITVTAAADLEAAEESPPAAGGIEAVQG